MLALCLKSISLTTKQSAPCMVYNPTWPKLCLLPRPPPATTAFSLLRTHQPLVSQGPFELVLSSARKSSSPPPSLRLSSNVFSPLSLIEDFTSFYTEKEQGWPVWSLAPWTTLFSLSTSSSPTSHPQLCSCIFSGQRLQRPFAHNRDAERETKSYLNVFYWREQVFIFLGYNCIIIQCLGRAFHLRVLCLPSTK